LNASLCMTDIFPSISWSSHWSSSSKTTLFILRCN
jgi:hypothetical protein